MQNQISANVRDHVHGDNSVTAVYSGQWTSNKADGASVVAHIFDTANTIRVGRLFELRNLGSTIWKVGTAGEFINPLWVKTASSGGTKNTQSGLTAEAGTSKYYDIITSKVDKSGYMFSDNEASYRGGVWYDHANDRLYLRTGGTDSNYIDPADNYLKYFGTAYELSSGHNSKFRAVRMASDIAINTGGGTGFARIPFNSETFDVLSEYDNSTNYRFTATASGYYQSIVRLKMIDQCSPGSWMVQYKRNGTITDSYINGTGFILNFDRVIRIPNDSDYMEVWAATLSSKVGTFEASECYWDMHKLGNL